MAPSDGDGVGVEQVLQAFHDGCEAGALGWLAGPAVCHELLVARGHVGRHGRPVPREHLEQDLQRQQVRRSVLHGRLGRHACLAMCNSAAGRLVFHAAAALQH